MVRFGVCMHSVMITTIKLINIHITTPSIMILACMWVWPVHSGTLAVKTLQVIRGEDNKSYPSKLQIFNTVSAIAVTRLRLMSLELACRGWSVGWFFGGRVQLTQRPKIHYTALKLIILPPAR